MVCLSDFAARANDAHMSQITDTLALYQAAEMAILGGQKYKWGDRELTRADLSMVQNGRREYERKAQAEARSQGQVGVSLANLSGMPQAPEGAEYNYTWQKG